MSDSSNANMSLWLSNSRIVVGDTTTLAVSSENTAGREPRFDWKSDGARIEQFENGRVAHVTYAQPGTYTVTATMTLRDGTRRSDSKTIAVDRVP
jgi:PKD repeat protein